MDEFFFRIVFWIANRFPGIVRIASRITLLRRFISNAFINWQAYSTNPRPRPFSMASSYTTWQSLTDRSFTGRHLPEVEGDQNLPGIEKIVDLWRRKENKEIPSVDTSILFSFFAQWFTDSFLRTDFRDRRKNTSNHEIDLCQIYGLREEITHYLRLQKDGKLKYQIIDGDIYPPYIFNVDETTTGNWVFANKEFEKLHPRYALDFVFNNVPEKRLKRMFAVGLEHGNSSIGYTIMNTLMLREHNRICDLLKEAYSKWDDERLFQTARNIMVVLLIKVVLRDYVSRFTQFGFTLDPSPGLAERQRWYRSNWISLEFNLLYRWHSMVPENYVVDNKLYKLDDFRNNTPLVTQYGIGALITAASIQRAGRIGLHNTHSFFFDPLPIGDDNRSVMERTVAMGRQARLRSFNDYRAAFSMPRLMSFEELTDDHELQRELKELYRDRIEDLEWQVGISAEDHDEGFNLGRLMVRMVGYDAFTHALTNPLVSIYVHNETTFSKVGQSVIEETNSLADIVNRNVRDSDMVVASFKTSTLSSGS
ncbi:peroxidase family protein [Nitrosovibrio sp. Nv4]|uniref:peroxidase family protein n=1 Tax=Nitrosovibrio sp. Nv4 TaxID=1945880 RepID=UPI000BD9E42F|nr:peroxidase family protein [Nitrosovibrio sp. Nv4]SOD40738.1 prostaglandin-endoperoxide synthase 2 [Nitrosovibrio sp. Nv4]